MSKVNVDEIKVGDLIGFDGYKDKLLLGYVNRIEEDKYWCYWSGSAKDIEQFLRYKDIDYHWKVINFEEEKQMDELKVYTGKETIEALLEGKTLKSELGSEYKLYGEFLFTKNKSEWERSIGQFNTVLEAKFTEVVTPQVGDWVRVTHRVTSALMATGEVTEVNSKAARVDGRLFSIDSNWEILSPEQVSEYKREQAFVKVGRKPNEFRSGDIVLIESLVIVGIVVSHNNTDEIKLNKINGGAGYTAKPHQLTPISFVENQVSLD